MRWKLLTAHYLNIPGTKWEYIENDRITNRPKRMQFDVPTLLDPADPTQWTEKRSTDDGDIIVCHPGKGDPRDLPFTKADGSPGDPTPDMLPLDDEAQALSDSWEKRWSYRPQEGAVGYSQSMIDDMQQQMAALQSKQDAPAIPDSVGEALAGIAAVLKSNQELMARMVQPAERRV